MIGLGQVLEYLEAKFGGAALPEVQLQRLATCFSCDYLLVEKRNERGVLDSNGQPVQNPYYYCKECNCPTSKYWKDSELRTKVAMDKAKCKKGKWI